MSSNQSISATTPTTGMPAAVPLTSTPAAVPASGVTAHAPSPLYMPRPVGPTVVDVSIPISSGPIESPQQVVIVPPAVTAPAPRPPPCAPSIMSPTTAGIPLVTSRVPVQNIREDELSQSIFPMPSSSATFNYRHSNQPSDLSFPPIQNPRKELVGERDTGLTYPLMSGQYYNLPGPVPAPNAGFLVTSQGSSLESTTIPAVNTKPVRPLPVISKNKLTSSQKLVIVQQCIANAEDFKAMGKGEYFDTQRQILKRSHGFDCNVDAVMKDIQIAAKLFISNCSEARSGIAVAESDLDQASVLWLEIVKSKEEALSDARKPEEEKQLDADNMARLRKSMTQNLSAKDKDSARLSELSDEETSSFEVKNTSGKRTADKTWVEAPGAGMSAGKKQRLSRLNDEFLMESLREQDDKMAAMYQETVTNSIEKLVNAISTTRSESPGTSLEQLRKDQEELRKEIKNVSVDLQSQMRENQNQLLTLLQGLVRTKE